MNLVPTLSPIWLAGLLTAVPLGIILLYFLKLRREPVEVPSTYLWKQTIEDLHVNSLLQRLRRSLLLLLQLLIVGLAGFALFRPGIRGETSGQGRVVFLLDASASMQATDSADGTTRFADAKEQIRLKIDAMSDTDTAMLVTFSDRAEVLQSFTSDRGRLRDALARAKATNRPTDVMGALRAADGLANPRRTSEAGDVNDIQVADAMPADLLLYSDGGFQAVTDFDLGNLVATYHPVGTKAVHNLAITAFSAERNIENPSEVQAFATIINAGTEPGTSTVSLLIDNELVDAQAVAMEPGDPAIGLSFSLSNEDAMGMSLVIDQADDLAIDNVAYAGLTPMKTVSVLIVTPGNQPLKLGLSTPKADLICLTKFVDPSFLDSLDYTTRMLAGVDDLVIFDRCSPKTMPPANTFFIGALPPQDWSWDSEVGPVVLVDIDRAHPLMRFVDLFSLLIFEGRAIQGPVGTHELVSGDVGSILSIAFREGYQDLVLGFEVVSTGPDGGSEANTNWYAERSWPVFVLNTLRFLAGAAEASGAPSYRPGETVRLRLENIVDDVTIEREVGPALRLTPSPNGTVEVIDTDQPSNYMVDSEDRTVDLFAINLFDNRESQIAVADDIELGYDTIEATTTGIEQRQEYWRWALIGTLGLLAAEWWYYGKRVA